LPGDANIHEFLGTRPRWTSVSVDVGLSPKFEVPEIENKGGSHIFRDENGVICQAWKNQSNIPHYVIGVCDVFTVAIAEVKTWRSPSDRRERRA